MPSDWKTAPRVRDPEALRRFRLEQENELCWMCDMRPGVHVHHRIHRSQGGGDTPDNLVWLCLNCHSEQHGIRVVGHDL
jgi:5-methylcytosine-specific restriction endonuclease McrA